MKYNTYFCDIDGTIIKYRKFDEMQTTEPVIIESTFNQMVEWKKITDFIHQNSSAKIGIQLGHSGRKGATKKPWETEDLQDKWNLISASPIAFNENSPIPKEMTLEDMNTITEQFVQATINANEAGFDLIELQAHHGFLLASFLSPLTNIRTDEFGGSVENRLKFPIRVFKAMRDVFPIEKPMSVRISATDWAENGISEEDVFKIGTAFKEALGDKSGIRRYGDATLPLDEVLVRAAVDLSGRPYLVHSETEIAPMIGSYDTTLTKHIWESFVNSADITLHIKVLEGRNAHHVVEAQFKAVARALRDAVAFDAKSVGIPSTKGVL